MGSFRSEPETKKTTIRDSFGKYKFAVSHMCGTYYVMKVGDCTWKMRTCPLLHSPTKSWGYLLCLMGMEVVISIYLGAEVAIFV